MATMIHTTADPFSRDTAAKPRVLWGGPRRRGPAPTQAEKLMRYGATDYLGSHMPIDADIHWTWRNPLNLLPLTLLIFTLIALISMV